METSRLKAWLSGLVSVAILVGVGVLVSSNDNFTQTRNAAVISGTKCKTRGQVSVISRQKVVCSSTKLGMFWYPILAEKKWLCAALGSTRSQNGILSVCGKNATKKKRWYLTKPLPKGFVPGLPSTKEAAYQNLLKDPSSVGGDPGIKVIVDDTEQSTGGDKVGIESKSAPTRGVIVRQPSGAINSSTLVIQPQVQLTDEANNPKLIAGIEVAVSANRADVVVTGGTATTDKKGVASFTDLALTGKTGDIELTFTPTGLVGATSDVFSVQSGKGIKFAPLVTAGNQVSGRVFNNPIKMQLVDVSGNNVTEPGVVVVATSSNKDLGGTVSVKTDANGVAVFSGLVLKAVAQTELTFSADKIESTTDSVVVVAGQYHSASIKTPPSTDALNNIALEQQPEVQLIDENGNDVLTSGVEIVVTIGSQKNSDNSVPQVVNETATTNDLGRAIFSELALKGRVGEYQISFTPKSSSEFPAATVTSETKVTLSAGVATQLVVVASAASAAPDAQINGWSLGVQSAIALADISGNTVASAGVTVTGSSSGQETTFAALTDSAGVATFSDFIFKGDGGQRTITYSSSIKPAVSIVTQNLNLPLILTSSEPWSIPAVTTDPKTFTLAPPTSNSDGAWTYTSSDTDVATIAGDVVTVITAGTTRITATQAATTKYGLGTSTADLAVSLMPTGATKWSIPAVTTSTNTFTLTPPTSNSDGAWTYTSSDTDVATITGDVVTITGAGSTRITATQPATTKYGGSTSTADLAVSLMPTGATKWSIPAVTTSTNTFTLAPPTSNSDGAWTYTSSDTDVATIAGDVVTVITAGDTTILARQAATTKYGGSTSTADLAVSLMPTGATKWSIPAVTTSTNTFTLTPPTSNSDGAWTYTSSDTDVATIAGDVVTVITAGTTRITATQAATTKYGLGTSTADLAVSLMPTGATKWSIPAVTTSTNTFTLTPPTSNSDGAWTYTSSDTDVATIAGDVVTVITAGTTRITATQAATTKYGESTSTADLAVSLTPATGATKWSIPAVTTSTNTFTLTAPNSDSDGAWTYTSSDTDVATIAGDVVTVITAGDTTILARQAATTKFGTLRRVADLVVSFTQNRVPVWSIPAVTTSTNTFTLIPPTSNSDGAWSYASSDTDVATVTGDVVTVITAGDTTITARQAATLKFGAVGRTTGLEVSLAQNRVPVWSIPTVTTTPRTFTLTPPTSNSDGAWTYTSSDTDVATVTGDVVTVITAGDTTILARQKITSKFSAGQISTVLAVTLTTSDASALTVPTGLTTTSPTFPLTDPESNSNGAWTYASDNKDVATVTGDVVTIIGAAGTAKITATQVATTKYTGTTTSTDLVIALTPAVAKNLTVPTGLTTTSPTFPLTDPESNSNGAWTYASDNKDVATVTGDVVTITGAGSTTITATQKATTKYTGTTQTDSLSVATVPSTNTITTAPAGAVNGVALVTQPVVQLVDVNGVAKQYANVVVTVSSSRTDVVLSGNTAVTNDQGIATFTNLTLVGIMGDVDLTFTPAGLVGARTSLKLTAGAPARLVSSANLRNVVSGKVLSPSPVLHLQDASGNRIATSGTTVTVTAPNTFGLAGSTSATTNTDGDATFDGLSLKKSGATALTFSVGDIKTQDTVTVVASDHNAVEVIRPASTTAANDDALAIQPQVQLIDENGNNVTTGNVVVTVKIVTSNTATLPVITSATATTNASGIATFKNLTLTGLVGSYLLSYSPSKSLGIPGATTNEASPTELAPGKLTALHIVTAAAGPSANTSTGVWSLATAPVIALYDTSDNAIGQSGVVITAQTTQQDAKFTATTDDNGRATFTDMTFTGDASRRTITYSASQVTSDRQSIDLDIMASGALALTVPTGLITTSPTFPLTDPESNSNGAWTYASDNKDVATVTGDVVTITGAAGTAKITATQKATPTYSGTATSTDLVIALTPAVAKNLTVPTGLTTTSPTFPLTDPESNSNGAWTYASDNKDVATVTGDVVTITGAGSTTITATQAATTKFASVSTTATLVIGLTPAVVSKTWTLPTDQTTTSDAFTPTDPESNSNGAWTYESSNAASATVTTAGLIAPQDVAGEVTITATQAATPKFAGVSTTATLVIGLTPAVVSKTWTLPTDQTTTSDAFTPTAPASNSNGAWTYESSNAATATVTTAGLIAPQDVAGTVTITATQAATPKFAGVSTTATLVIGLTPAVVSKTWTLPTDQTTTSDAFTPTDPESNSNGAWTYTSSKPATATVTTAGQIAPQDVAGTVTITATQAATTKFASVSTTADLVIALTPAVAKNLTVPTGLTTTSPTFPLTDPESNSNGAWTYASDNKDVATVTGDVVTITGAGSTTITATQKATTKYTGTTQTDSLSVATVPSTNTITTAPAGAVNGVALVTQPVVQLVDVNGVAKQYANVVVTVSSSRTDVVLSGNTAVTNDQGIATFTNLTLVGIMGDVDLTFTPAGLVGARTSLKLTAGAPARLVSSANLRNVVSGKVLSPSPVLHLQDASGNRIATSGTTVTVTAPNTFGLAGSTSATTNTDGDATFDGLSLKKSGTTALTFSVGDIKTQDTVTVVASDHNAVEVIRPASTTAANDDALAIQPQVQLIDENGNNVTTGNVVVTVKIVTSNTATLPVITSATATTNASGIATFKNLTLTGLVGSYLLSYSPSKSLGIPGATTNEASPTELAPGKLTALHIVTAAAGPSANTSTGVWSLATAPVIALYDTSDNAIGQSGVVITAQTTQQDAKFTATTDDNGRATFTDMTFTGDASRRTITYSASQVTSDRQSIDLDIMASGALALTVPTGLITTSPTFPLTDPESNSNGAWTYASDNKDVATVTGDVVTITGAAGTAKITATQKATPTYSGTATSTDLVIALTPAVAKNLTVPTGLTTTSPTFPLTDPESNNTTGAWTYASSDATIATVTTAGQIAPQNVAGTVKITATQAATTKFAGVFTTFDLVIALTPAVAKNLTVPTGLTTTSPTFPLTAPNSDSDGAWTYASDNKDVATVTGDVVTITGAGSTTITATQVATTKYTGTATSTNLVIATVAGSTVGSTVFYYSFAAFSSNNSECKDACHYLEAAPQSWGKGGITCGTTGSATVDPKCAWSGNTSTVIGPTARGTAIGIGSGNTTAITTQTSGGSTINTAATSARAYTGGSKTDWFLPSKDELNELCKYARGQTTGTTATVCASSGTLRTGFAAGYYWSSSESDAGKALYQDFNGVSPSFNLKTNPYHVRPVRAF